MSDKFLERGHLVPAKSSRSADPSKGNKRSSVRKSQGQAQVQNAVKNRGDQTPLAPGSGQPTRPTPEATKNEPEQKPANPGLISRGIWHFTRRDAIIGGAGVVGAALCAGAWEWFYGPRGAVRDDRAVKDADRAAAQKSGPIHVDAAYRWHVDDQFGWAFEKLLTKDQEKRLLGINQVPTWLSREGGVGFAAVGYGPDTSYVTRLRLTLTGTWIKPFVITDIRANVRRSPPLSGALAWCGAQGETAVTEIGFNLDEKNPVARVFKEDMSSGVPVLGEPYADHKQIIVNPDEPIIIDLTALTANSYCEWSIEFSLDVDTKPQKYTFNDGGQPFRSTAAATLGYRSRYYYRVEDGQWHSEGPGKFE